MIVWPDFIFPPVNLYTIGPRHWPKHYLELETEFCSDIQEQFDEAIAGTMNKEVLGLEFKDKREEFNRLWNSRVRG